MKSILKVFFSIVVMLSFCFFTYANQLSGSFLNDGVGILYIQNNGVPIRSQWITFDLENDGKEEYYYFASDGHLTVNGKTEDGYMVNEKGQWVVNGVVQYKVEELDRQAQAAQAAAQAQAIAQQQALQAQQAQQAQAAAQQAAQAQAQAKQGTDKKGHPYLQPGASYTWGADGPIEAPASGKDTTITDSTGDTWLYDATSSKWISFAKGDAQRAASMEKERQENEGVRQPTEEDIRMFINIFGGN